MKTKKTTAAPITKAASKAASARKAAGRPKAAPEVKPAQAANVAAEKAKPKPLGARAQAIADAEAGKLPPAPDFSAATHKRFRAKLAAVVALAAAGDIAGLKAFAINPISSSPKAIDRYRNLAVTALEAKAAKVA
jgi:hypothetical protein